MPDKTDRRRSRKNHRKTYPPLFERINPNAAGIDCGSEAHYVAVPADRGPERVRSFKTFTTGLHSLADWLTESRITTVAMEATGVYWIPLYEILEARGFQVLLVNARHVRNVPGRKSDVMDCEWIQELHSVGLLRGSFRPEAEIVTLRSYMRHRESLIQSIATITNRMEKALLQMNLQLHVVISDIVGVTGLLILRDIVKGQTDPMNLAQHRDPHCKASLAEIAAALTGNYRPEHIFALRQNLELFDSYHRQVQACDAEIEKHLRVLAQKAPTPTTALPPARRRRLRQNDPRFEIRDPLHRLTNMDLTQIDGIGPSTALRLIAEIGTDMSRWPTASQFASWTTLAPNNRITGGRLMGSKQQPSTNRAAQILRMATVSIGRTQTALGAFYRRLAARVGKAKAVKATARKLAELIYRCLKGEITYKDPGVPAYDCQFRDSAIRRLKRHAKVLGFGLIDAQTGEVLDGA